MKLTSRLDWLMTCSVVLANTDSFSFLVIRVSAKPIASEKVMRIWVKIPSTNCIQITRNAIRTPWSSHF
jgi:hypothetical protein